MERSILNFVWVPIYIDLVPNFKKVDSKFFIHFSNLVRVQFIFPWDLNHVCRIFIDASLVFETGFSKHYTPFLPSTIFDEMTEGQNEVNQINYENIGKTFFKLATEIKVFYIDLLFCWVQLDAVFRIIKCKKRKTMFTGPYKCLE